ncbi:MAG: hypothetical protein ABIO49_11950, partial [Dokdonella sp.]
MQRGSFDEFACPTAALTAQSIRLRRQRRVIAFARHHRPRHLFGQAIATDSTRARRHVTSKLARNRAKAHSLAVFDHDR